MGDFLGSITGDIGFILKEVGELGNSEDFFRLVGGFEKMVI